MNLRWRKRPAKLIALGMLASVPSAPVFAAGLAFVGIGRQGLALLHERTNQKFEIEEWVAFACPLAYINSFNALVEKNVWLQKKLNAELKEQEVKLQFNLAFWVFLAVW